MPETHAVPDVLKSTLVQEDPDMREIVLEFVDSLRERITDLRAAYSADDWARLCALAHQLKGAGGSYGYEAITGVAARMEKDFALQRGQAFDAYVKQLEALVSAARAGL